MKKIFILMLLLSTQVFAYGPEPREIYHSELKAWEIFPGGGTTCAYGSPYSFYFIEGDPTKLIIDFVGGGSCWSEKSCRVGAFRNNNNGMEGEYRGAHGIYKKEREDNPFKTWSHLVVGYCTGDLHWGDNVVKFGEGDKAFNINFKGAVNARAALDWIFKKVKTPEWVFITGTSAGSYGSVYWAPTIIEKYKDTAFHISQMGDSGAGVITRQFFKESFKNWNALKNTPDWIPEIDDFKDKWQDKTLSDIYTAVANYYPKSTFSQFNFSYDQGQIFFLELMGRETDEDIDFEEYFFDTLKDTNDRLHTSLSNYTYFIPAGLHHSFIPMKEFYTLENEGVKFTDWVSRLVEGGQPKPVICTDCEAE